MKQFESSAKTFARKAYKFLKTKAKLRLDCFEST